MDRHISTSWYGAIVVLRDVSQEPPLQIRDGSEYASRNDVHAAGLRKELLESLRRRKSVRRHWLDQ